MKLKHVGFMTVVAAFVCAMTFASCTSDDDTTNNDGTTTSAAVKSVTCRYSFTFSPDLLSIAKVYVSYLTAEGDSAKEELTDTTWQKTVTFTTFPSKMAYRVELVSRGATLMKGSYVLKKNLQVNYEVTHEDGSIGEIKNSGDAQSLTLNSDFVETYLKARAQWESKCYNLTLSDDKSTFTPTYVSDEW